MTDRQAPTWGRRERTFSLVSFAAVVTLIVVFLLGDARSFVNSANDELLGHTGASAGFAVAATGTILILRRARPPLLTILVAGAALTVLAELAQALVPDRAVQLRDVATGFGGVLVAALFIELVLRRLPLLAALRVHTAAATVTSLVLAALLVLDLAPQTIDGVAPDGDSCPLTAVVGTGNRITLGNGAVAADACVRTDAGGFGLFGPEGITTLRADSVLVSSPLVNLAEAVVESGRLLVRTEFVTDTSGDDVGRPGVIVLLRSDNAGELLQVRTRDQRVEVFGPTLVDSLRGASQSEILEPNTRYVIEVELTESELRTFVDGELIATVSVNPAWVDVLADPDTQADLTLYVGNARQRTLPARGTIEWIEIDT